MLGYHALLYAHASGIPLFLRDSTGAYATRQGNDHYVYHNAAMTVATSNGCPTSTVTGECSLDQKRNKEVCEPTGGSISRMSGPCVGKLSTHPSCPLG